MRKKKVFEITNHLYLDIVCKNKFPPRGTQEDKLEKIMPINGKLICGTDNSSKKNEQKITFLKTWVKAKNTSPNQSTQAA